MTMQPEYPKAIKRRIRELAGLIYERGLTEALTALERDFARWRQGRCDAFELEEQIHRFHDGVARELWKKFSSSAGAVLDVCVAEAIATGKITAAEAGVDVLIALREKIEVVDDLVTSDLVRRASDG
jgi:hypothetical protein